MKNMTIHRIRLSKMQKIVNVLAVASSVVSLAVVGSGIYVYLQRDQLIDNIKSQAIEAVLGGSGGLGGALGGSSVGGGIDALPTGANDLSPQTNPAAAPQAQAPVTF
jgi:hypothetical protein